MVQLSIRISKNNQIGQRTHIGIPSMSDDSLCPVCLLRLFLKFRSKQYCQLFLHCKGKPLTRSQCSGVFDKAVKGPDFKSKHIRSRSVAVKY